ncbi:MAG: IS607 family transposase [Methanobacteriota archaeon]|nr:MAG: IS607 family transposase [Euryarchaeota archaeon]
MLAFGYARVSGHKQSADLERQKQSIRDYANEKGYGNCRVFVDIASGLNDQRRNLKRMIKAVAIFQPKAIIVTYHDRLARFGISLIRQFCQIFGTRLISIHQKEDRPVEQVRVEDVIAIMTSYAGKLHRRRRVPNPSS